MSTSKNKLEYISFDMLEDLGFTRILDDRNGTIHQSFEIGYSHPKLDPFNLILVDYKNGSWHFAQRMYAMVGIGQMIWLDDLLNGFQFVTGQPLI